MAELVQSCRAEGWEWLTNDYHDDDHRARDDRLVFVYSWMELEAPIDLGWQGAWVQLILR